MEKTAFNDLVASCLISPTRYNPRIQKTLSTSAELTLAAKRTVSELEFVRGITHAMHPTPSISALSVM